MRRKREIAESGQMVLILVLLTIVGLTIGISLISRSITDVRISSQTEQSIRAFSAAEAGVESALRGAVAGGPTGTVSLPGASANYEVTNLGGVGIYNLPVVNAETPQTVWLIPHNEDGSLNEGGSSYPANRYLDICWGTAGSSGIPAIIVSLLYKEGATYKLAKGAYDPDAITRGNNFTQVTETAGNYCSGSFRYKVRITPTLTFGLNPPPTTTLLALRILPIYASTAVAIEPEGGQSLPLQGKKITSVGQTQTGVVRKVQVTEEYKSLPSVFDFTLFTEN